jgi:hypothetical protein
LTQLAEDLHLETTVALMSFAPRFERTLRVVQDGSGWIEAKLESASVQPRAELDILSA